MVVRDRPAASRQLAVVSYYRLSAYWYPLRSPPGADSFARDVTFERVVELYEFDRHLRLALLDAIERVEVAVRTKLTYEFAHRHGPSGHCDPAHFEPHFNHASWLTLLDQEVTKSRETFAAHYRTKYIGFPRVPLWMATEVMSFGALTRLYKGCRLDLRADLAKGFGCHESVLASWLLCLSYVRNLCAHHSRVWNRDLAIAPKIPHRDRRWHSAQLSKPDRAFGVMLVLRSMLRSLDLGGDWAARMEVEFARDLADPFIARGIGIAGDWAQHPVWRGT